MALFAPKDPQEKRRGFYVLLDQAVGGLPQNDGVSRHPIYLGDGRLVTFAKLVGGITDQAILELLPTAQGFLQLVHSIGVSITAQDPDTEVGFDLRFRGDLPDTGSVHTFRFRGDGVEQLIDLTRLDWQEGDTAPAEFTFHLGSMLEVGTATVKLYVHDGYQVPDNDPDPAVERDTPAYREMIARSCLSVGNNFRLKRLLERIKTGENVTIAFVGGSITQGAGAIPIQTNCYPRKTHAAMEARYGQPGSITYRKAGVGGTPSQLGLIRFDRDLVREQPPDLVVIEFAVNDAADELEGGCYESLVQKALSLPGQPAVILLFAVFASDWNLKTRLAPIGWRYQLPMVNVLDAVTPEFRKGAGKGVLTKRQFFYDQYHPSNLGHTIMADCLLYLLDRVDQQQPDPMFDYNAPAVYEAPFRDLRLLDRSQLPEGAVVNEGSFTAVDTDLQSVPLDDNEENTPQFPHNWQKAAGNDPFTLTLTCAGLMLAWKDSGSGAFGKAEVRVDGQLCRTVDPLAAGWVHCSAGILINEREARSHTITIRMAEGEEDKTFTILGFGYTN